MTMQQKIEQFKAVLKKMKAYQHAMGVMFYDFETVMPKGAAEDFAAHMGILSEEVYKMQTAPEFKALIDELYEKKDGLDLVTRREVEVLREDSARTACIPMEEYVDYQKVQSMASSIWHEAKVNNDYAAFKPYLKQLVDYNRKFALYYAPDKDPYDTMLDQFEKGLTRKELDGFFGNLREKLLPLINETSARRDEIDDSFLFRHYPVEQQRAFSDYLMQVMGIDRNFCTIGEVEHPFTTNFTKHDVRITTHYYENAVASSLYSVVHEGGHALYELHTGDELNDSPLGTGTSMGIHESQSRLFENIIGRSEEFTRLIFPKMEELFPEQLKGVTAWDFYRAVNKSVPSLIRTEADELTYSFHIMVRYELEKQLIGGTLSVDDLPAAWNKLYKEYLGVDVPDDTHGVLQDSHWSGGSFGYFPSYAIGSAYGAQFMDAMRKDVDVDAVIRSGDLSPVVDWLTDKIYRFGMVKTPEQLIRDTCGAPFEPQFYVDYLTAKFTDIYGL